MIIYKNTKEKFIDNVESGSIAGIIENEIYQKMGRRTPANEFRAWENSLQHMCMVLNSSDIPNNAGIAIEYNIPQTSKRVDFIVSGYSNVETKNIVIVELKQWSELKAVEGQDSLVETYTGNALRKVVHPSYQAWSYSSMIRDYNQTVQENHIELFPCAYLHNYHRSENDPLDYEQYRPYYEEAPAFTFGELKKLRDFIKKNIKIGDNGYLIDEVDCGKIKPSKSLQDCINSMVKGNQEFVLLDDQMVAYEEIKKYAIMSQHDHKKRTIIVEGGPGTGKTVLAINLLSDLTQEEQFVQYVTKNSAPREVFKKKLKGNMTMSSIDNMFKGSGSYTDALNNTLDTILTDEAHRLNEKSGLFQNLGENQIKEIIKSAKCSVFFIDESQRVTLKDIGSKAEIKEWANELGSEVYELELTSQFRCNGSDGYLAWLDNVLEIRETANLNMKDIDYDIRILDSPDEVFEIVLEKNNISKRSRLLAGYCWDWIKDGKNNPDVKDIEIGDFKISWNLGNTSTYAIDESSVNEAGCIHTTQGLEFDYVGVIIGDDLRYEDGKVVTDYDKRAKTDQSLKGIKKLAKSNPEKARAAADEIIKNTYRTLMTRGMKGCYVYCTDDGLREYLKERL